MIAYKVRLLSKCVDINEMFRHFEHKFNSISSNVFNANNVCNNCDNNCVNLCAISDRCLTSKNKLTAANDTNQEHDISDNLCSRNFCCDECPSKFISKSRL